MSKSKGLLFKDNTGLNGVLFTRSLYFVLNVFACLFSLLGIHCMEFYSDSS